MKKLNALNLFMVFLLFISFGCNTDNAVENDNASNYQTTIQGNWIIDKIQILQAPSTNTPSAIMKTALLPFGLMSVSEIGSGTVSFGAVKWGNLYSPSVNNLTNIQFVDDNTGWASGNPVSGHQKGIVRTTNGGALWYTRSLINGPYIYDISFLNSGTGYAIAEDYIISKRSVYKSTDGGDHWNWIYTFAGEGSISLNSISFVNELTGWVAGTGSDMPLIAKTTDGGNNWFPCMTSYYHFPQFIKFYNSGFGIYSGYDWNQNDVIFKTFDGGNTWISISIPNEYQVKSIQFVDNSNGFAVCTDKNNLTSFYKTVDGGSSWSKLKCIAGANALCFKNQSTGYISGSGCISKTTNGGNTWSIESGNIDKNINSIFITNSGTAFAAGENGIILKSDNMVDRYSWTLSGEISNPLIKSITKSKDNIYYAGGSFYTNDANQIHFEISGYSNGLGNVKNAVSDYKLNSYLNLTFNLANQEKWLVILRR